jgi:hypothetical protein
MAADDVVSRIVELSGAEVVVVDPIDVEGGYNVGQGRRAVCHLRIMPQPGFAALFAGTGGT